MSAARFAVLMLRSSKPRNAFLIMLIALIISTSLTLMSLAGAIETSLERGSDERGIDITVSQRSASDLLSSNLPATAIAQFEHLPRVASATGELVSFVTVGGRHQVLAFGWSHEGFLWRTTPLVSGALPQKDAQPKQIVIGAGLAESLGLKLGDTLRMLDEDYQISGIAGYASVLHRSVIITRLDDLQDATMRGGQVTFIHLKLDEKASREDVGEAVRQVEADKRFRASPVHELLQSDRNFRFFSAVSNAISLVAMIMGVLCSAGAFLISLYERRRDLAILAALGWPPSKVVASVGIEAMMVGALAGILALPIIAAVGTSFRFLPGIGEIIVQRQDPGQIAIAILSGVALTVLGAIYPTIAALRADPLRIFKS